MGPMDLEGLVFAYTLEQAEYQKHKAISDRVTAAFVNTPTDFCTPPAHEDVTINALLVMHRILKSHPEPNVHRYDRRLILACNEEFYFEGDVYNVRYRYILNADIDQIAMFTDADIADLKKAGVLWNPKTGKLYFYEYRSTT